jgi:hypothetical protein
MNRNVIGWPLSRSSSLYLLWLVLTAAALPWPASAVRADGLPKCAVPRVPAATRPADGGRAGGGHSPSLCNVLWGERGPRRQRPVCRVC